MINFDRTSMILYSVNYVKDNYSNISQTTQCKAWLGVALNDLKELPADDLVTDLTSEIQAIDQWFSERTPLSDPDAVLERIQKAFDIAHKV